MMRQTAEQILGVSAAASKETILKAFRDKARESHPDSTGPVADAVTDMAILVEAKDTLLGTVRPSQSDPNQDPIQAFQDLLEAMANAFTSNDEPAGQEDTYQPADLTVTIRTPQTMTVTNPAGAVMFLTLSPQQTRRLKELLK